MLPMSVNEGPYDLSPVIDFRRLSGRCPRNVDSDELAVGEKKSALGGAFGDTDNLTSVVDAPRIVVVTPGTSIVIKLPRVRRKPWNMPPSLV